VPGDQGLQAERTALAWQRTGVAGCAVGASATAAAAHLAPLWVVVVVAVVTAAVAVAAGVAVGARRAPSSWARLLVVASVPTLLGAAGALLALTPPS